jgi:tetratricopeptide (TPR) repeat protein
MPRKPSSHVDDPKAVGLRLKEARETAGLTQRKLGGEDCSGAYVSRIEAGERIPSYQLLRIFGKRLGVTASYLATGEAEDIATVPLLEAELAARTGDFETARGLYEQALETSERPSATAGLGQLAFAEGDHIGAIALLEAVIADPALSDQQRRTSADQLGRAYAQLARYDEAIELFRRELSRANDEQNAGERMRFSVLLANTLIDRGDFVSAEQLLAEVIPYARDSADPMSRAVLLWSQSRLQSSQGRPDLAASYARQALATLDATEHTLFAAKAFALLAQLENDRGHYSDALDMIEEGFPTVASTGNHYEIALFELEKARALCGLEQFHDAGKIALGTVPVFQRSSAVNAGRGFATAARVFRAIGDQERALELLELAAETLPSPDQVLADVYSSMADVLEHLGKKDEALMALRKALLAREGRVASSAEA